jgi:exonuclease SbcC
VNAIDLCLFGPPGRSFEPYLTEGDDQVDMVLELVFEHRGNIYRARRGFSAKGRGKSTLDLEVMRKAEGPDGERYATRAPMVFETLTRENVKATQDAIEQIIGLSRDTFRASAFLAQGDGASFTEADPRDRKRILAEILGLGVWAAMVELVRRDKRAAEQQLDRIGGLMEHADEDVARIPALERTAKVCADIVQAARIDLGKAEAALEAARVEYQRLNEQTAARTAAVAKVEAARVAFDAQEQKRQTGIEAIGHASVTEQALAALPPAAMVDALEREEQELRGRLAADVEAATLYRTKVVAAQAAQERRADFLGTAAGLNEKAHALREQAKSLLLSEAPSPTCDRCGQALGVEAAATAAASMVTDAAKLDEEAGRLVEQGDAITIPEFGLEPVPDEETAGALTATLAKLDVARAAQAERATLEERLAGLQRTIDYVKDPVFLAGLSQIRDHVALAEAELRALPEVEPDVIGRVQFAGLQAKARVEEERVRMANASREQAVAEGDLARLRELEQKLSAARAQRVELQASLDLLEILERAYGRDGIPALIVSNTALPAIELEATRILQELGTSYRVELRTEKALKSGGIGETLDVVLITEAGERPYETLSGGERTRLNLALRIALARLLSHRRGAESRLLAIDEPEFLDAAGTAALATVLQGLTGDFDRIYLVSHVPDLAGAFDQVLTVTKDGDRSSVAA